MDNWQFVLISIGASIVFVLALVLFLRWLGHEIGDWLYDALHK